MNNQIKVMHISANQYPPLPKAHHTLNIWRELSTICTEYHVFSRAQKNFFNTSREGKVFLHLIPSLGKNQFSFFITSFLLIFYARKLRPTHFIAQCPAFGGIQAAICKTLFGTKLLVEIHGEHYFKSVRAGWKGTIHHLFFRFFANFTLTKADRIRSLSSEMSKLIIETYGEKLAHKIVLIPNRVNLKIFGPPKIIYHTKKPFKIITVGNFVPEKNHIELIHHLFTSEVDFELTIVGAGPLKDDYVSLANSLGISEKVTVLENLSHLELAKALRDSDIYIHYSLTEAVSRAIMEAMAIGLPVISTNVGYLKDLILDSKNGFIIHDRKPSNLKSLLDNLDSVAFREQIGRQANLTIKNGFEWNYVFDIYRKAIRDC